MWPESQANPNPNHHQPAGLNKSTLGLNPGAFDWPWVGGHLVAFDFVQAHLPFGHPSYASYPSSYYINYLTKAMQLEDPRGRSYRQLQDERCSTESIALQVTSAADYFDWGTLHFIDFIMEHATWHPRSLQQLVSQPQTSHNSSPYHVHPSNNLTAIRAFQERQHPTLHNVSTSPLLSASSRGQLVSWPKIDLWGESTRNYEQTTIIVNQVAQILKPSVVLLQKRIDFKDMWNFGNIRFTACMSPSPSHSRVFKNKCGIKYLCII